MKHFTEAQVNAMKELNEKKVSQREIAELLGCSTSTVNRRVNPAAAEMNRVYSRGYAAGKRAASK